MPNAPVDPARPLSSTERDTLFEAALANTNRPNGITDDQLRRLFAAAGHLSHNPGYFDRLEEGIAEYRRQIQEELERELADAEGK